MVKSGIQRSILSMYRSFLRIAYRKEDQKSKENLLSLIRAEFRKHIAVSKRDFTRIESLVHKGNRQLDSLQKCKSSDKFLLYQSSPLS